MKNIDLKSLRLFLAVCEHGHLKTAATQENIEPSAVSKRLASLEEACGAKLLIRNRHGAKPTAEGQVFLEHARSVLFTMDRAEADLAAFKGGIKGQVRLAASASAIAESLLDDVASFMRLPEHERIQVDIEEKFSKDIVTTVQAGLAPLGICWSHIDFGPLQHRLYRQDELVLALPPGHALAKHKALPFEDTLSYEHIGLPPGTAVYSMLHKAAEKAGQKIHYRVVVSNFDSAFRVVAAGLGISVMPKQVALVYAKTHRVKTVKLLNDWAHRQFAICFKSEADLSPAALRLLEHLSAASITHRR